MTVIAVLEIFVILAKLGKSEIYINKTPGIHIKYGFIKVS